MNACIVLAGGSGRRMGGADKAALTVGSATMLDGVLDAAAPLCSRLVVVGPPRPTGHAGVVFTIEEEAGGGPVPAIVAGMAETAGAELIVVLAVDLPLLSTAGLERLLCSLDDGGAGAAAALDDRGRPNPLLAVYRTQTLRGAVHRLAGSQAGVAASELLPPDTLVIDLGRRETLNVNTPQDLAAANRAHAASHRPPP